MTAILYLITVVVFCVAVLIVPNLFMVLIGLGRSAANLPPPVHWLQSPPLLPHVIAAILLMLRTRAIWESFGYKPGWLLIGIIALVQFLTPGKTPAGNTNAYGTILGLIIYGIFWRS